MKGVVYFVQAGDGGPIKIGPTTNDIRERVKRLQTGNPENLTRLLEIPTADCDLLERERPAS
jgi:hypothetical protein